MGPPAPRIVVVVPPSGRGDPLGESGGREVRLAAEALRFAVPNHRRDIAAAEVAPPGDVRAPRARAG